MEFLKTWLPIILSAAALVVSLITFFSNVSHDKKKATLDAYNILQSQVLDKLNSYTKKQIEEISANPRSEEYKEISALLARVQHFAVGVNTNIYDEKVVKRLAGKYFLGIYDKLSPLIEKKRSVNKTEKHYDEFEQLVVKIKKMYK